MKQEQLNDFTTCVFNSLFDDLHSIMRKSDAKFIILHPLFKHGSNSGGIRIGNNLEHGDLFKGTILFL